MFKVSKICLALLFAAVVLPASLRAADAKPLPETRPAFESSIVAFEKSDLKNPPPKDANLFIGSSSIVKWKTLAQDFPGVAVINRGFGGSRIADSTRNVSRIVLPYHPKRIFLYAGDNDLAAKGGTPEKVSADFQAFVNAVRAGQADVPIYFISIKPSPSRAKLFDEARKANALVEAYTKERKNLFYIDVFTPMLGPDGKANADLFGKDMLHMNAQGYALWTKIIAPLVKD